MAAMRPLLSCRGHYGFVFEGVHRATGRRVAIKKIDRTLCTPFRIQEEVNRSVLRAAGAGIAPREVENAVCVCFAFWAD
jgi:hypothetical protein